MKSSNHKGMGHAVVALAALAATSSFAQTAGTPPVNAGRALEATTPKQQEIKKDANVLPDTGAARPASTGAEGPTVMVKGFQLTGNTVFPDSVLLPLVQPWVGKQAGTDQLLDAAEAIKNRYKDAGYFLTQVFVPAQQVTDGIVTLRVVEARIGQTQAEVDTKRVQPSLIDGYMRLLPSGSPVTEQAVERPLLLLNDLPGLKVNSVMRPGANTGEADLLVKVVDEGRSYGGDAYVDNAGNKSSGTVRLGVDGVANGVLGHGESLSLGGLVSEHNGLDLVRGGATVPVGNAGTKATVSLTDLNYKILGAQYKSLDADGYAFVASGMVQHPLIRSRNFNVFATGGLDFKVVNDRQNGGAKQNKRDIYLLHAGLTGDFRDERFGGSLNAYTLTITGGDTHLLSDQAIVDQTHHTTGMFAHVNADYQRLQSITDTTSLMLVGRGQYAFKNLDTAEKASLGGPTGMRGFAVGDGVGDQLFQGTIELRQRIPAWSLWNAPLVLSAYVDGGRASNWHSPTSNDSDNARTLGDYGVGVNLTARDNFQFRLDVAHRINKGPIVGSDNRMTRAWASLQKWF
ncbi:MAG: ShlB/FhaC/HecB family hemolysin secretion/activation protein [Burkholderiaceae bacterium]